MSEVMEDRVVRVIRETWDNFRAGNVSVMNGLKILAGAEGDVGYLLSSIQTLRERIFHLEEQVNRLRKHEEGGMV